MKQKNSRNRYKKFLSLLPLLHRDRRGATAVEFALILPIMVLLYLSTVEISQAISVQRKVAIAAGTLGDLTAQYETVNDTLLDLIFYASQATILPYSSNPLTARLTSYKIDAGGTGSVAWSYQWHNGVKSTYAAAPEDYKVPNDLKVPNTSVVVSEIIYNYTSPIEFIFPTSRTLTSKTYFRPRLGSDIPFQAGSSSTSWDLATTGSEGDHLAPNWKGFGAEYRIPVHPVDRDGNGATDPVPPELQNAENCYYNSGPCGPGPGHGGDPGSGGGTGGCYMPASRVEVYNMPLEC